MKDPGKLADTQGPPPENSGMMHPIKERVGGKCQLAYIHNNYLLLKLKHQKEAYRGLKVR